MHSISQHIIPFLSPAEKDFALDQEGEQVSAEGIRAVSTKEVETLNFASFSKKAYCSEPGECLRDYFPEIFSPETLALRHTQAGKHLDLIQAISCIALVDMGIKPASIITGEGKQLLGRVERLGLSVLVVQSQESQGTTHFVFNEDCVSQLAFRNAEGFRDFDTSSCQALITSICNLPIQNHERDFAQGVLLGYPESAIRYFLNFPDENEVPYTLEAILQRAGIDQRHIGEIADRLRGPNISDSNSQFKLWDVLLQSRAFSANEMGKIIEDFDAYTLKTKSFGIAGGSWRGLKDCRESIYLERDMRRALTERGIPFYTCDFDRQYIQPRAA